MNQVHGPLSSASDFFSIFEGGRGPEFWQRQQTRQLEWINAIRRSSVWLEELIEVDLELSGQPLLGNTLAALMSPNASSTTVPAESTTSRATFREPTRTGKPESKTTADGNGRKRFRSLPDRVPEPKQAVLTQRISTKNDRAESVLQLQPQAGSSLLRRIAGTAQEFSSDRSNPERGTNGRDGKRNSALEFNVEERSQRDQLRAATLAAARSAVVERFVPPTRMAPIELATLLERAARRLTMTWARESLLTRALSSAVEPGAAKRYDLRSLTAHWSMPVSGPAASADLLVRLAGSDRSRDLIDNLAKDIASQDSSALLLPSSRVPAQAYDSSPSATRTIRSLTAAPVIAPPSVTPTLPPLHSHKQDDVVLPVAAATAQRQARIEEHIAREDDLPLLAERLDRILKQEARRHGIDV